MNLKCVIAAAVATLFMACAIASAENAATQPTLISMITRSDLADADIRFEKAYMAHPPLGDAERARVHQAYDQAVFLYYQTRHAEAIQAVNELTDSLTAASADAKVIHSLQVRVAPPVARRTRPGPLRIRVSRMYAVPMNGPLDLRLVIRSDAPESKTVLDVPVRIDPDGPPFTLTRAQPESAIGRYLIELIGPDGTRYPAGRWSVIEVPLDSTRITNERRLSMLRPTTAETTQAVVACRSRNTLMSDARDENNPAQFLADPIVLSHDVQSEVEWLSMGKDPYFRRPGDIWRAILAGGMEIPSRVYAPPQVQQQPPDNPKPLPLVIALHEGGGDESTFMQFIGDGRLKKLAEEKGFILVTPNVNWVARNITALDSIVEAMSVIYPVDSSRVYVIGHGTGALAAIDMAAKQPSKVTKLVLFSAGDFSNASRLPPTLLYAGEVDPLFPPDLAQAALKQAQAEHLPVELKMQKAAGHCLIVRDSLDEAVDWLLK
ncbi:MAG TPA: hypothetical protein VH518_24635 [Tepidisphaeraceae bacterium]